MECDPAGGGLCAKYRARSGAPVRPAPARQASTSLLRRYVPASRARPDQPGGDPAAPIGCRSASTAADERGRRYALGRRRRVGAARRLHRRPRLALLRRARRGRMAPRSAKPRARPEESGRLASPRAVPANAGGTPPRTARLRSSSCRLPLRRADRSGVARSWNTRAQTLRASRCASLRSLPPTPRVLRSAPSSLHSEREPPLAALALRRA